MSTPTRLAAYAAALALTFTAAFGLGSAVGQPPEVPVVPQHGGATGSSTSDGGPEHDMPMTAEDDR